MAAAVRPYLSSLASPPPHQRPSPHRTHTRLRYAYAWVLNFSPPTVNAPIPGTMQTLFTDPGMLMSTLLVLSILVCYLTFFKALQRRFRPTLSQLVQEIVAGASKANLGN